MSYTKTGTTITVTEGNGIDVDNTNPLAPVVNVDPSELSFLQGITAGSNVVIDYTNPVVPIISTTGGTTPTWQDTLNAGSDLTTDNVIHQDGYSTAFLANGSLLTFGGGSEAFNLFQVSMVDGTANTWSDIYNTVNQLRLTVRDPTNYDRRIRIDTSEILFKSNILRLDTTDYPTGVGYVWTDVAGTGVMTLRPPTGGGVYTASNGLGKSGNDIQLGGVLTYNTPLLVGAFNLTISGNGPNTTFTKLLHVNYQGSQGTGSAILGAAQTIGNGVKGTSPTHSGVYGTGVQGVTGQANGGAAGSSAGVAASNSNATGDGLTVDKSGTYGAGHGIRITYNGGGTTGVPLYINLSQGAVVNSDYFSILTGTDTTLGTYSMRLKSTYNNGGSTNTSDMFSIDAIKTNLTNRLDAELSFKVGYNTLLPEVLKLSGNGIIKLSQGLLNFTDDTTAAAGGIPVNGLYRTGSAVKIRVV